MEALNSGFVLICSICMTPDLSYNPLAERLRFPPDAMLQDWMRFNIARQNRLNDEIQCCELKMIPLIMHEQQELRRIHKIMWWMEFTMLPENHKNAKLWMKCAKGMMTPREREVGYIPWGGIPEDSLLYR